MRLLIIPDLHHHIENAEYWLRTQKYDRVLFLGDYFDDFEDNVNDARKTASWLRQRIEHTDDIFLLGNHDAAYMFPDDPRFYCPGFTRAKAKGISEILFAKHWQRFELVHAEGNWLFSHAGYHPSWVEGLSVPHIVARAEALMRKARRHVIDPIFGVGLDRGGAGPYFGGPLWLDWNNLAPIAGINQVVGHTQSDDVRSKITRESRNYCLDVGNGRAAAILFEGEELSILER